MSNPEKLISLANELRNAAIQMMLQAAILRDTLHLPKQRAARGEYIAKLGEARRTIAEIRAALGEEATP
jgi:hypothetical protein